jgi:hypothetical protein
MARNSSALMCSLPRVHFHPDTIRQRQSDDGTLARSLWYLTSCDEVAFNGDEISQLAREDIRAGFTFSF